MTGNIDALISESQGIRDDLLKTIGRLEAFSIALTAEAGKLQDEVSPYAGHHEAGTEQARPSIDNPDAEDAGTEGSDSGAGGR
jgi:hypothetical protein